MKKRILAVLLGVCLVFAPLPSAALAAPAANVSIWGRALTAGTPYYHNGANGAQGTADNVEAGHNAYFDAATGTLYLQDLSALNSTQTVTASSAGDYCTYAIYADGDLKLHLTGRSTVSTTNSSAQLASRAVYATGSLTVTGTGSLTATGGLMTSGNDESCGVFVYGDLTMDGGTLTGKGGETQSIARSIGVQVRQGITVNGGTLRCIGGTSGRISSGCVAFRDIFLNGGVLEGKGGAVGAFGDYSYGVSASSGGITVSNGTLTGEGGEMSGGTINQRSVGIKANILTVDGGVVTGIGRLSTGEHCGVEVPQDGCTIHGGRVIAKIADAAATTGAFRTAPDLSGCAGYRWRLAASGSASAFTPSSAAPYAWSAAQTYVEIDAVRLSEPPVVPKTGDSAVPGLWLGMLLLSAAALTATAALRRRRRTAESGA